MDWQYPVCWQSDCSKGDSAEKEGFSNLLAVSSNLNYTIRCTINHLYEFITPLLPQSLREAFDKDDLILSVSVSGYPSVLEAAYDLPSVGAAADLVSVMTYDYRGFWDGKTGHHSPLGKVDGDANGHNAVSQ